MPRRNWFSNFIPFDKYMLYSGMYFRTPEHFYQAMKSTNFEDCIYVYTTYSPAEAKRRGNIIKIRKDWEVVKQDIMKYALKYKFRKGTKFHKKLIETKGSIVEWNYWHDNIWGNCFCYKCEDKEGENLLGKLLMALREEFKIG